MLSLCMAIGVYSYIYYIHIRITLYLSSLPFRRAQKKKFGTNEYAFYSGGSGIDLYPSLETSCI